MFSIFVLRYPYYFAQINSILGSSSECIIFYAGFLEFKDVEIQCQQDNELAVKVGMSEHCKSGEFWVNLQNACVEIMELIDWERSRPGSVYDISCSYGVDSAWIFFVQVYIFISLCLIFAFPLTFGSILIAC